MRIAIPTVLEVTDRDARPAPFVELALDDAAFRLAPDEAAALAGWMRVAAVLGSAPGAALAAALEEALATLAAQPPLCLERVTLGFVQGETSDEEAAWLEVALEAAVREPSNPRIVLELADSPYRSGAGDTWWLLSDEAFTLAGLLDRAAQGGPVGPVGRLEEKGPNRRPFLHVAVAPDPAVGRAPPRPPGVELRFDDDLLAERGEDGVVWLLGEDARRLARLLLDARRLEEERPAHRLEPPAPGLRVIATLS